MPTQSASQKETVKFLIPDWGIVDGHLVYLPLWDPPKEKKFTGFKELMVANALINVSKLISESPIASKLRSLAKEMVGGVSKSIIAEWQDGDPICPPNWPPIHWHFGGGGGNPDPDPVYHPIGATLRMKNDFAGLLLKNLGEQAGMKPISQIGTEIMEG